MELEIDNIKNLLHLIQNEELPDRVNNIKIFQQLVWNNEFITKNALVDDILLDLAYDLDFYEPNPDWRKEDISFYDEDRLVQNIEEALQAIEALEIKNEQKDKDQPIQRFVKAILVLTEANKLSRAYGSF